MARRGSPHSAAIPAGIPALCSCLGFAFIPSLSLFQRAVVLAATLAARYQTFFRSSSELQRVALWGCWRNQPSFLLSAEPALARSSLPLEFKTSNRKTPPFSGGVHVGLDSVVRSLLLAGIRAQLIAGALGFLSRLVVAALDSLVAPVFITGDDIVTTR